MDGTVQFYTRIQSLIHGSMDVLDLGAGRGLNSEANSRIIRELSLLKGKVRKVTGVDIDNAVLTNCMLDEAIVYDGQKLPLTDSSIDLIVSDHTFEHISDPPVVAAEISRVLRPNGWVCARTPHLLSLLAAISAIVPNRSHVSVLEHAQPGRMAHDVFPTFYRMNSSAQLKKLFSPTSWNHYSYTFSPEPAYHCNSKPLYLAMSVLQYIKQPILGGEVLLVFMQKKTPPMHS